MSVADRTDPSSRIAPAELDRMAHVLERTGRYRVLRRLSARTPVRAEPGVALRRGLFVDVETTGIDPMKDEILEFGGVPFDYSTDGKVLSVGEPISQLREPGRPIPPEIVALTGIDTAMVAGKSLDLDLISEAASRADLILAHHAAFDRKFLELICPTFVERPWGCSLHEVPWAKEGIEGRKLGQIAAGMGFFFEGHRATDDCLAGLEVLARPLPRSGGTGLAALLASARRTSWLIAATGAPFPTREVLKARGYRWHALQHTWAREVPEAELDEELAFLRAGILPHGTDPPRRRITAFERHSDRAVL